MKRSSPFSSPKKNSQKAVGFFQQFPRQFVRPYGEADTAPNEETILKRIKPFTCEWLLRPKIALSEFSDTILKNTELMKTDEQNVLNADFVSNLETQLKPLKKNITNLNREHEGEATEKNVVETLKFLYKENDELDNMVDSMFHVGGALFVTAIQYIVARTLIRNPEEYAQRVESEDGSDATFQRQRDIVSMKDYIVHSVIGKHKKVPSLPSPRKSLLRQFDSPSKSNDTQEKTSPHTSKRRLTLPSDSSSESDEQEAVNKKQEKASVELVEELVTNPLESLAQDEDDDSKSTKRTRKSKKAKKTKD